MRPQVVTWRSTQYMRGRKSWCRAYSADSDMAVGIWNYNHALGAKKYYSTPSRETMPVHPGVDLTRKGISSPRGLRVYVVFVNWPYVAHYKGTDGTIVVTQSDKINRMTYRILQTIRDSSVSRNQFYSRYLRVCPWDEACNRTRIDRRFK